MAVVRGNDKIAAPFIAIAECDIGGDAPEMLKKYSIEDILHHVWGFDNTVVHESTGKFYEVEELTTRTRSNRVVKGLVYRGRERLDDDWIEKGRPSDEAKVAARQDLSYVREVAGLSRQMKSL